MSDPPVSDIDFKNKMAFVLTTLNRKGISTNFRLKVGLDTLNFEMQRNLNYWSQT